MFQPLTGLILDKRPVAWSLPIGMSFSLIGILNLAFATNLYWLLASVFVVGMADKYGIESVYNACAFMPLLGLVTWFLPDLKKIRG